ncbi:MAG: hypothetical protein JW787_05285 [Sedimentisphaerales bacterium]|nr:hypothetical protein [Sedimentisphaerales bacterium]
MLMKLFNKISLILIITALILVFTGPIFAQGRSDQAFERVWQVQQRNTERLMAMNGVEGTAIGLNNNQLALKVFTSRPGVAGIPGYINGVPVQIEVTGRFYSLAKPLKPEKPGKPKPPGDTEPPLTPTGLYLTTDKNLIALSWTANTETDLAGYKIYYSFAPDIDYILIGTSTSNTFSDDLAVPFIVYSYAVTAVDTYGNESAPAYKSALTESPSYEDWPSHIGVSTGHPDITAGTIGCRVKKVIGDKTYVFALSNNHVYANENIAILGDNVLQPGTYDYGVNPDDAIGVLYDYVPIKFGPRSSNTIDSAIALCSLQTLGNSTPEYFGATYTGSYIPSSNIATAVPDMLVKKYGRTTGLTSGSIYALSATVKVGYDSGMAIFVNQIIITPGTFSAGGDSGSLIVTQNTNQPVGLLFAGSSSYTIANPIGTVLSAFGVTIDDTP